MCGRFTNRYSWRELKELYELSDELYPQAPSNFEPRYNIAPTQNTYVVRLRPDGRRELADLRWGLLPSWCTSAREGARMINARQETLATSPAYREAFRLRPCLVVADGFYEWLSLGPKDKQPYFIRRREGRPFAFAGLWQARSVADRDTFTIVTGPANAAVQAVHDRMPRMLVPSAWTAWLGDQAARADCLAHPVPPEDIEMWPVGKAVGHTKNEGPELIAPLPQVPAGPM